MAGNEEGPKQALLQYKQQLIKAVKDMQYTAALDILFQALAIAPEDALLLEFQATVQAMVAADDSAVDSSGSEHEAGGPHLSSSGSEDDYEGEEECEQRQGSGSQNQEGEDASSSEGTETCSEDEEDDSSGESSAALASECHHANSTLQESQNLHQGSPDSLSLQPDVVSIQLAPACCTLTHQRRAEMREQLKAAVDEQKAAGIEQWLVQKQADPLLAA